MRWDFSSVRVHVDDPGAQQLGARAWTRGSEIGFAPGAYRPHHPEGRALLAHELAHHIQQTRSDGAAMATARAEPEAEAAARAVAGGQPFEVRGAADAGATLLAPGHGRIQITPAGSVIRVVEVMEDGSTRGVAEVHRLKGGKPELRDVAASFHDAGPYVTVPADKGYHVIPSRPGVDVYLIRPMKEPAEDPLYAEQQRRARRARARQQWVGRLVQDGILNEDEARQYLDDAAGPTELTEWEQQMKQSGRLDQMEVVRKDGKRVGYRIRKERYASRVQDGLNMLASAARDMGFDVGNGRVVKSTGATGNLAGYTVTTVDRYGRAVERTEADGRHNKDSKRLLYSGEGSAVDATARATKEKQGEQRRERVALRVQNEVERRAWLASPEHLRSALKDYYGQLFEQGETDEPVFPSAWSLQEMRIDNAGPDELRTHITPEFLEAQREKRRQEWLAQQQQRAQAAAGGPGFGITGGEALAASHRVHEGESNAGLGSWLAQRQASDVPVQVKVSDVTGLPSHAVERDLHGGHRVLERSRHSVLTLEGREISSQTHYIFDPQLSDLLDPIGLMATGLLGELGITGDNARTIVALLETLEAGIAVGTIGIPDAIDRLRQVVGNNARAERFFVGRLRRAKMKKAAKLADVPRVKAPKARALPPSSTVTRPRPPSSTPIPDAARVRATTPAPPVPSSPPKAPAPSTASKAPAPSAAPTSSRVNVPHRRRPLVPSRWAQEPTLHRQNLARRLYLEQQSEASRFKAVGAAPRRGPAPPPSFHDEVAARAPGHRLVDHDTSVKGERQISVTGPLSGEVTTMPNGLRSYGGKTYFRYSTDKRVEQFVNEAGKRDARIVKTLNVGAVEVDRGLRKGGISEMLYRKALTDAGGKDVRDISGTLMDTNRRVYLDARKPKSAGGKGLDHVSALKETPAYHVRSKLGFSEIAESSRQGPKLRWDPKRGDWTKPPDSIPLVTTRTHSPDLSPRIPEPAVPKGVKSPVEPAGSKGVFTAGGRTRRELQAFWRDEARRLKAERARTKGAGRRATLDKQIGESHASVQRIKAGYRPSPRQSEREVAHLYGGSGETVFINGRQVEAKVEGSTAPDVNAGSGGNFYVEVKRYILDGGRSGSRFPRGTLDRDALGDMVRELDRQITMRRELHLRAHEASRQAVVVDLRGQKLSMDEIQEVRRRVATGTSLPLDSVEVWTWGGKRQGVRGKRRTKR